MTAKRTKKSFNLKLKSLCIVFTSFTLQGHQHDNNALYTKTLGFFGSIGFYCCQRRFYCFVYFDINTCHAGNTVLDLCL